jgi:uncharacterized membrane protein (DUF485 family)
MCVFQDGAAPDFGVAGAAVRRMGGGGPSSGGIERQGRNAMAAGSLEAIQKNPKYHELVVQRRSLGFTLSAVVCVIYYGFILLVAFAPSFLGASLTGGVTTVGIPLGILVILAAFLLTGFYVSRANRTYDSLTQEIIRETIK